MFYQVKEVDEEEKEIKALDEKDIALLKSYGQGQYTKALKAVETDIVEISKRVNELAGIKVPRFKPVEQEGREQSLFLRNPTLGLLLPLSGILPLTSRAFSPNSLCRWGRRLSQLSVGDYQTSKANNLLSGCSVHQDHQR